MQNASQKHLPFFAVIAFGLVSCVLYGVGAGLRSDIGILLNPLASSSGLSYDDVSFCIAVMQIVFGASQPLFGLLAAKKSNRFVLIAGAALLAGGLFGMMKAQSFAALLFFLGFIFGLGVGALAFGLILTSAIYFVGRHNAMLVSGMLNAAAGLIGFVLAPLLQALLDTGGLTLALSFLAVLSVVLAPVAIFVTSRDPAPQKNASKAESLPAFSGAELLREALANRTYRLLLAGFSTCGFHMVIIESHLFSQFVLYGLSEDLVSWAFSMYGIATIAGALLSGFLSTRVDKARLLAFLYGFRAVWVAAYLLLMPKTFLTAVIFAAGLGATGDATVSPTSGLVSEHFRLEKIATLIGVLFLVHQVGAFASAWLGGILRTATGGYGTIWAIDIGLCLAAAAASFAISYPNKTGGGRTSP